MIDNKSSLWGRIDMHLDKWQISIIGGRILLLEASQATGRNCEYGQCDHKDTDQAYEISKRHRFILLTQRVRLYNYAREVSFLF